MAISLAYLCLLALITTAVISTPINRRQDASSSVERYITQVRTAVYVIDSLRAGNESASCLDIELTDNLDAMDYDGQYAQGLLCEAAIGIEIFSDLNQASEDMTAILQSLNDATSSSNTPSRLSNCHTLSFTALDEAGLDGAAIQDAICEVAESSTFTPSSEARTQSFSQSATSASPSAGNMQSSCQNATSLNPTLPKTSSIASQTSTSSTPSTLPPGHSTSSNSSSAPSSSMSSSAVQSTVTISTTHTNPSPTSSSPVSVAVVTVFQTIWVGQSPASQTLEPEAEDTIATSASTTATPMVDITTTRSA